MDARTHTPRPFVLRFHSKTASKPSINVRTFARLDNALPRATQLAMQHCVPGDVAEIHHAVTSKQLATIKVKAGGKLESWFIWEDKP